MTNPVPGYSISTPYKKRGPYWSCDPDSSGDGVHTGQDYAAPAGAKVVAARPGTVRHVNHGSAFGNHQMEVVAEDGTADFYAHMRTRKENGVRVEAGDKVGEVGSEGNVTGAHLHFEKHAAGHSGWSCSVHRDPMPSHNYKPEGGQEEDVPEYGSARRTANRNLKAGQWYPIEWDDIKAGDCFAKGEPRIAIGGHRYSLCLTAVVGSRNGANVRTSFVEIEDGEAVETNPTVTHDKDYVGDSRIGSVAKGRVLRARILCDEDAVLEGANVQVLYW